MINQDNVFKKIGFILNELQDQYEYLAHKKSNINEVEVDFFMANVAFLNENAQLLKKVYQPTDEDFVKEEDKPKEVISTQEKEIEPEKPDFVFDAKGLNFIFENEEMPDKFDYEIKPVSELFDRPLREEENLLIQKIEQKYDDQLDINEEEIGPEPFLLIHGEKKEQPIEGNELVQTLNDLLQNHTDKNRINERKSEMADLKSAINLNDKILYIKELFNGYNLAYSEAIELVSKMPNYEAAAIFLQKNYAIKNNWDEEKQTVRQFYSLLDRYFKNK